LGHPAVFWVSYFDGGEVAVGGNFVGGVRRERHEDDVREHRASCLELGKKEILRRERRSSG